MTSTMSFQIGTWLNERYRLDANLGQGGLGVVFKAHDSLLERDVAIKLLSTARLSPKSGPGGTGSSSRGRAPSSPCTVLPGPPATDLTSRRSSRFSMNSCTWSRNGAGRGI